MEREDRNLIYKIGCITLAVIIFFSAAGVVGKFAFGWFSTPFHIYSAENVSNQWKFAYTYDESLTAAARQVCTAQDAENDSVGAERVALRQRRIAREDNYNRIAAEFNARLRNAFEAKLVKPDDVPDRAPTLEEKEAQVC